jgi:hypothetical protein
MPGRKVMAGTCASRTSHLAGVLVAANWEGSRL